MSEAAADVVSTRIEGRIAWVAFNRPEKRNCMSPTLNRRMLEVIEELEFRDDVGVLVLTGEGSAWSAGMDLKEYFRETEAEGLKGVVHLVRGTITKRSASLLVIDGLVSAHGVLQRVVARELRLKHTPTLDFLYDDSVDRGLRIAEILEEEEEAERRSP